MRTVVHEGLLQSDLASEAFIIANGPGVTVDFVHLVRRNTNQAALLDDGGIFSADMLYYLQVLHRNQGLYIWRFFPFGDLSFVEVNMSIKNFAAFSNGNDVCYPMWLWSVIWVRQP